jgi:hypothetical protein
VPPRWREARVHRARSPGALPGARAAAVSVKRSKAARGP